MGLLLQKLFRLQLAILDLYFLPFLVLVFLQGKLRLALIVKNVNQEQTFEQTI